MCGIFAVRLDHGRIAKELDHALAAMHHRGPDGRGSWSARDRRTCLGHTRLAVIGLDARSSQPLANEDGTVRAAVNGELYGFEQIRSELEARGHRFATTSDAEILVHLYEESGLDCLRRLRGEFAFVLFDARHNRLVAARDRFGVKPLVYAHTADGIWIASEAKALFAAGIPARWDVQSLRHAASLHYVLPDRTLFEGVKQLEPGHVLVAGESGISTHCYWDLDYPRAGAREPERDEREIVAECRERVVSAITTRLRADVPVCVQLSGGLDSSTVLGVASQDGPVDAFTIAFDVESYDELARARDTAEACGAHLHPVHVSQRDLIASLGPAVVASDGLAINGHLTAKFLLHRAIARAGYKVVLTGEGADEVFAGYAHLRVDHGLHVSTSQRSSLGMMMPHGKPLALPGLVERLGYVPTFLAAKASLGRRVLSLARDPESAAGEVIDALLTRGATQLEGRARLHQSTWLWTKTALASYILNTLGDGTEMPHSVEGRTPFLDHELFELVREIPVEIMTRGNVEKHLLRESAREYVTNAVHRRPKHPLDAPPVSAFATREASDLVRDLLRSSAFERQPLFCPRKTTELVDRLPGLDADEQLVWDPVVMMALSTIALQEVLDETPARSRTLAEIER